MITNSVYIYIFHCIDNFCDVSFPRLSTGQNKCYGNILLHKTSGISVMIGHFDCKHRCLVEKNVPTVFIFPSRWQDGAESLGIETPQKLSMMEASTSS